MDGGNGKRGLTLHKLVLLLGEHLWCPKDMLLLYLRGLYVCGCRQIASVFCCNRALWVVTSIEVGWLLSLVLWKTSHLLLPCKWREVLLLEVPCVENGGIVVIEGDINVENCHEFVKLHIWFGYELSIFLLLSLESSLISSDLLDDLKVGLKFDQGDSCRVYYLQFLNPSFRTLSL